MSAGVQIWVATLIVILISSLALYPIVNRVRRRNEESRPDGLYVLSEPANPTVEIVAVHGLGAHPEYTWTYRPPQKPTNADAVRGVHLLRDLLKKDFPRARILSFAYNSDWLADGPVKTAQQIGDKLLERLQANRCSQRLPIIFIGHSFGGIVIKEALCKSELELREIIDDAIGIIFLGTPHQGSRLSTIAAFAAWLTAFLGSSTGLLLSLRDRHSQLTDLETRFRSCVTQKEGRHRETKIISFCETKPMYILRWISIGLVVDQESARGPASELITIDTDHSGLNKCSGNQDRLYKDLRRIAESLQAPSLLKKADDWIRDKHYTEERLKIERLSGDRLDINNCYINLAIIEKDDNVSASRPSNLSLFAHLRVETPKEERQIALPTLFSFRKCLDGLVKQPKRILIRGRAGVGKTTLCKRIIHDFIHQGQYTHLFDRLLWLPLRRLKGLRDTVHNLEDLFYHEYFHLHVEGRSLANMLWREVVKSGGNRTLFILDGLDEISDDMSRDNNMFEFINELLSQPNAIITSRPHGKLPIDLASPDLELETIGFYPDQVSKYLQRAVSDDTKVGEIQSFIDSHWLIQGLVRIPIQLDAVCFTWESFDAEAIPQTMSDIYTAIEKSLWKKDILRLRKRYNYEPLNEADLQSFCPSEIEDIVEDEIRFLEYFAFMGLYNDVIEFYPGHVDAIYRQFKLSGTKFSPGKTLPCLSFLRTSDPSLEHSKRTYHFLHLTLQEYFAARYFSRQWKAKKVLECFHFGVPEPETYAAQFLQRNKYAPRYNVFWRFVSGLLDAERHGSSFFEEIENEPRDLLGPTHQRLVLHCLSEATHLSAAVREPLEQNLLSAMLFEYNVDSSANLAKGMEFPDHLFASALQHGPDRFRIQLAWQWRKRGIPPGVMALATSWQADGKPSAFQQSFCRNLLDCRMELPEEMIHVVASWLDHPDHGIKGLALKTLATRFDLPEGILQAILKRIEEPSVGLLVTATVSAQTKIPDAILQTISSWLEHPSMAIRRSALLCLGHLRLSNLPEGIARAVSRQTEDPTLSVKDLVIKALYEPEKVPNTILEAISTSLENKDSVTQYFVREYLATQESLPEKILQSILRLLEDPGPSIRKEAILAFNGQSHLQEAIHQAITRRLADPARDVRWKASGVLRNLRVLPEASLRDFVEILNHENGDVRQDAIKSLQGQSSLPPAILNAVKSRLEDVSETVRLSIFHDFYRASKELKTSKSRGIHDDFLLAIAASLDDKDLLVKAAAARTLKRESPLPEAVFQAAVAKSRHDHLEIRWAAEVALNRTPTTQLPTTTLRVLQERLQSTDDYVSDVAFSALVFQSSIPESIIRAISAMLDCEDEDLIDVGLKFLAERPNPSLPKDILRALLPYLEIPYFGQLASKALQREQRLPSDIIQALVSGWATSTEADPPFLDYILDILEEQSNLPESALQALSQRLRFHIHRPQIYEILKKHDAFFRSLFHGPVMKHIYKLMLRESFEDHVSWHIEDGYLCVNTPEGSTKISIAGREDEVLQMIEEARSEVVRFGLDDDFDEEPYVDLGAAQT